MGRTPVLLVWPGQAREDSCETQCWPSALSPHGLKWLLGKGGKKGLPLLQDIPAGVALLINSPGCQLLSTCQGGERRKQSQEGGKDECGGHSLIHSTKIFLVYLPAGPRARCWNSCMNLV